MYKPVNPFITYGYESADYFCDREEETSQLTRLLVNGNNTALVSPRRMGKTGLLHHCFSQKSVSNNYITFIIDIYATKNLADMVYKMGHSIVKRLKPWGQGAIDRFLQVVTSLRTGISFDGNGNASWNMDLGDIKTPDFTLDEIFTYLQSAGKPCIVAIDEFQTIANYPEQNVEALLRTYVQNCRNAVFVFSGSHRRMMTEMFASPSRPFYQSVSMMNIGAIPLDKYEKFAQKHFSDNDRSIAADVVPWIYQEFDGTTWYIQKMLNELYSLTLPGNECTLADVPKCLTDILNSYELTYQDLLTQLTANQVALLKAICSEGKATQLTSASFISKHHLHSASSVQKAARTLLDRQIITRTADTYEPYDKFLSKWMQS